MAESAVAGSVASLHWNPNARALEAIIDEHLSVLTLQQDGLSAAGGPVGVLMMMMSMPG